LFACIPVMQDNATKADIFIYNPTPLLSAKIQKKPNHKAKLPSSLT